MGPMIPKEMKYNLHYGKVTLMRPKKRFWSDCKSAQADLKIHWPDGTFSKVAALMNKGMEHNDK